MATLYLRPNAAGDYTQITFQYPASGEHWDKVDEVTPDEMNTYVYTTSTSYLEDLYNLTDTSQTGTINWIKVWIRVCGFLEGAYAKTRLKTGATYFLGSEEQTTAWANFSKTYSTNPEVGGAWTWAQLNALQAGAALKARDIACWTQGYVEVDFTPAAAGRSLGYIIG